MRFKKSKAEILRQINCYIPYVKDVNYSEYSPSELNYQVQQAIKYGIQDGIDQAMKTLMENIYTDEEFEKDLSLDK